MENFSFPTTRWTLLGDLDSEGGREAALEELCSLYWYPLYGHVRFRGRSPEEAEDLTQAFFADLLASDGFARASADRGKLRSFLLGAMDRFLASEYRRATALKRGGGQALLSIDAGVAESRLRDDFLDGASPEKIFAQRWAQTLLDHVGATLRQEYEARGRAARYEALQDYLVWNAAEAPYREVADALGMSEAAVRQSVVRMRKRYATLLREHVVLTVGDDALVEEEIRDLFAAFSSA